MFIPFLLSDELVVNLTTSLGSAATAFLQKQVVDLQETIKLLTIKQLPGNQKGVFTRIKEFFIGTE